MQSCADMLCEFAFLMEKPHVSLPTRFDDSNNDIDECATDDGGCETTWKCPPIALMRRAACTTSGKSGDATKWPLTAAIVGQKQGYATDVS